MFVLDSDIYSHLIHEHPRVVARMEDAATQSVDVGIAVITKIEILQGRMAALLKADTHERFLTAQQKLFSTENALRKIIVIPLDESALRIFDQLLTVRGLKKIGRADLLIASIARANDATLVTRNLKHFRPVPHLKLENWVD